MQKLVNGILQETIDDMPADSDPDDDSPYERTLCAAWDVCTVNEYAVAMASLDFHRVLLKVNFYGAQEISLRASSSYSCGERGCYSNA